MAERTWQPTTFRRFEESYATSIGTAKIVTDAGLAYIKPMGNPEGPHVLACEWVGSQLARWFGLPTFDFAIMEVDEETDEIPLGRGGHAESGPAFVSRAVLGHAWGGSEKELKALANPEAIPRLVVFDTWTLNCDRYPPDIEKRKPNWDNVFLSCEGVEPGELRLVAMDHTHCFTCGRDLTAGIASIDRARDPAIYGMFPPFADWITKSEVERAANKLRQVDSQHVRGVVGTIPAQWDVSPEARTALCRLICDRARFVSESVAAAFERYYSYQERTFDWQGDDR